MSARRMLPFVLINVVVSTVVVLGLLFWWDSRRPPDESAAPTPTATANLPLAGTTALGNATPITLTAAAVTEGPVTHAVVAGDTLGSISVQYDVPVEDIMAANGLTDPNVLQVDQQLIIPVGGLVTPTVPVSVTAEISSRPSPIPTEPLAQGETTLEITGVEGVGQAAGEVVTIVNSGAQAVSLEGWQLVDQDRHIYTFEQVTLFGEGAGIRLHTGTGADGPSDLYWGLSEPVWEAGETVSLLDAQGEAQARYEIP